MIPVMENHKEQQRAHFDVVARTLPEKLPLRDSIMALHQVVYNRNARRLPLRDGDRVLEVGFGWVQLVRVLAGEANFQGVGIDLSLGMVAAAHRERGRMHFLVGDAESLPFQAGSFDSAIATSLLEHLPHQDKAVQEIHRVLKPGGHLLTQFPVQDDFLTWQFFYRKVFPKRFELLLERLAHVPALMPTPANFKKLLKQSGFKLVWAARDEVLFQPIYDYYVLALLDRLKLWKDSLLSVGTRGNAGKPYHPAPISENPRGKWRPRPAGIHRILLPLASSLLLPDYLLAKCGIGAVYWTLSRKQ